MAGTTLIPDLPLEGWPAISIYLPTERAAPPARAGATRLRRALGEAQAELRRAGFERLEAGELLRPAAALLDDLEFWQHQLHGLALFIGPRLFRNLKLSFRVPELVVVGRRFHITPLLPLRADDERFLVLALTAGRVELYDCGRDGCRPVDVPGMPRSLRPVVEETEFQPTAQLNPIARRRDRGSAGGPPAHGLESPAEIHKAELLDFLHRVDAAVAPLLKSTNLPLILAAEPEILGHYRKICGCSRLHGEAVAMNPFAVNAAELHRRASALLAPTARAAPVELKQRILARLGSAEPTVSLRLEEILAAAEHGRIGGLLLATDAAAWGRFSVDDGLLDVHGTRSEGDEDLLNRAAAVTLDKGGEVYGLPLSEMPRRALAAAMLRF
jgi:hypothetical protein